MQLALKGALALAGLAVLGLSAARPAAAQGLDGTQVTGSLMFGSPTNVFDPANGGVPAGFSNTAGTTVTVTEPQVEFGYQDAGNLDTADFRNNQLIISDTTFNNLGNNPLEFTFTDPAFMNVSKTFDSFGGGGLTYSLVGDVLTISAPAITPGPITQTAIFALNAPVPEASTTVSLGLLLMLGMGGVVVAARKKRAA